MAVSRILLYCLRIGELAFAAVVAGLIGKYIHQFDAANSLPQKRFIYTEVVAGLAMLVALIFLVPFTHSFIHWPVDIVLFVIWIIAFALLVDFIGPLNCGSIWSWGNITEKGTCERWKAAVAFSFLSAVFWIVSAILGWYLIRRARKHAKVTTTHNHSGTTTRRRRWYRSHHHV